MSEVGIPSIDSCLRREAPGDPADHDVVPLVHLDDANKLQAFLGQPAEPGHHIVQFYEDEGFLCDNVAHFLRAGLRGGEPVLVIATESHRKAFRHRLRLHGCDVEAACASGQMVLYDARETLAKLMVGDMPDWERFRAIVGGAIEQAKVGRTSARVRAYGEMVDLLWRDGNRNAAIALEEMWNQLQHQHAFSLLCAYVMANFYKASDGEQFREICRQHSHVVPTEAYLEVGDAAARQREISELQQRARSLEHEIEQRKLVEAALRDALLREKQLRQDAERTVRYNDMFSGMLGHDLRNPLGAISVGANYIARFNSDERITRIATKIMSSSERMSRMIDQLLDFTRIRVGGGLPLIATRVDLRDLCSRVRDEIEVAHPDQVIVIDAHGDTAGEWDYDRLLQVFSNLLGNAVSHGTTGCTVTVHADGDAANVVATIHNRGAVAPEILPVMFEAFRGSAKRLKTNGLGLGLFISKQIVIAHGGSIDVLSNDEDGTTVRVELPRRGFAKPAASEP